MRINNVKEPYFKKFLTKTVVLLEYNLYVLVKTKQNHFYKHIWSKSSQIVHSSL